MQVKRLFNIYGFTGGSYAGNVYDPKGLCPAINTMGGGNREPLIVTDMGKKIIQQPRGYNMGGLFDNCPTITGSSFEENNFIIEDDMVGEPNLPPELIGKPFRIRKMTPRELFRFMDVDDADIDKIEKAGLSKTAMGKIAGNAICVGVLYHIFRKLFIETDADVEAGDQLSLF